MSDVAQPLTEDDGPLSPWWIRTILIVMVLGFTGLIAITMLSYSNAPPIPAQVVDEQGGTVFNGDDISNGQAIFLKYGLMANGSIWGHGAYLVRIIQLRLCIVWGNILLRQLHNNDISNLSKCCHGYSKHRCKAKPYWS